MKNLILIMMAGYFVMFGFKAIAQSTNGSINTMLNSATVTYNGTAAQLIPNATAFPSHGIYNLVINNASGVSTAGSSYINLWGAITLSNGTFTTAGSLYIYGSVSTGSGQIQSGSYIVGFYGSAASQTIPVNAFVNNTINVLYINNTSTGATVTTSGNLKVPATLALQHGALILGGSLSIGGAITYTAGGITAGSDTVTFNGSAAQTVPGGTFNSNTVNNLGIANPSGISFSGPIAFSSLTANNLGIVPALTDAGQTTTIGGPLAINSFSGTPTSGQTFVIDTAGTVSGTFSSLMLPSGYTGSLSYTSQAVKLTLATVPGSDYTLLKTNADTLQLAPATTPSAFSVYPNPATGSQVTLLHEQASGKSYIKISSLEGRLMSVTNVPPGTTSTALDVSYFRAGLYIINYYNNGKVKTTRLLR